MKRILALSLALGLLFLCACARTSPDPSPEPIPDAAPALASFPASTPEPTPEPSPEAAPEPTPEAAPEPTPETAPETPAAEEALAAQGPVRILSPEEMGALILPASSSELSLQLAMTALTLCTGHGQDPERQLLERAGFTVLKQANYDKAPTDFSHTCAWTLGKRQILHEGRERTLLLVAVRGTNGGEWISNFDFAPSHDDDTQYAENFLLCAEEVLAGLRETLEQEEDPLLLLCGHSRGAACANLLGVLLDEEQGEENVYVYTFATPTTLRGEALEKSYGNIFNFLNPCDVVTLVPPLSLGYGRAGQDIILPNDRETAEALRSSMAVMDGMSPSISEYYEVRHSLTGPGLSEDGLTAFEFMCLLAGALGGGTAAMPELAPDSDFAPLAALGEGGGQDASLLMQHMPTTYLTLMLAYSMVS